MSAAKTETATARRLERARSHGDAPCSPLLVSAGALVGAAAALPWTLDEAHATFAALLGRALSGATGTLGVRDAVLQVMLVALPLVAASAAGAGAATALQTGQLWRRSSSNSSGSDRRAAGSLRAEAVAARALAAVRALCVATALTAALWYLAAPRIVTLEAGASRLATTLRGAGTTLAWALAGVALALGLVDAARERAAWRRRHRMTPDEARRERRETESAPEPRRARELASREARAEQEGALGGLQAATALIVDGTALAVAVRAGALPETEPKVVGLGRGPVAQELIRRAALSVLPVVHHRELARSLGGLRPGARLPRALRDAVGDLLASMEDAEHV